ncbi:hypothetical protein CVT24_004443 [Panaeolus cyanescens]|uniref:DUF3824 domain-containing protein n=1 Tax=Panaeolus cyanescens TaxID=181874 RepID=A0A409YBJ8_9AGAR|nr:hypothetical protein CVT24_004443 [Panaeolus cyanescens]
MKVLVKSSLCGLIFALAALRTSYLYFPTGGVEENFIPTDASSAPLYETSHIHNLNSDSITSRNHNQLYTRGRNDPPERIRITTTRYSKSGKKRVEQTSIHYEDGYSGTINIGSTSRHGFSSSSRPVGEPPGRAATMNDDRGGSRSYSHNNLPPSFQPAPGRAASFRHRPERRPTGDDRDYEPHRNPFNTGPRRSATMGPSTSSSAHRDRDRDSEHDRSRRPPPPPSTHHSTSSSSEYLPRPPIGPDSHLPGARLREFSGRGHSGAGQHRTSSGAHIPPVRGPIYEESGSGSGGSSPVDSEFGKWDHMPHAPSPPPAAFM